MTAENEREIYHKLEAMKEIRNKTITLERLKRSILTEVRSGDAESRCLAQYKREMELLQQEKMSHVEELRQIHADINAMETVIKQTEESMSRKLSAASRLHEDYRPLKAEVDLLRRQCLGLERLPELHEEEGSPVTPDRFPALSAPAARPVPFLAPAPVRKPPPPPPAFRQQPPPMKSCLSCHQQIHRNAPICPLCKAKSRSRNPKKPKKK
ncbi:zinc finger C4H2 domain-containing protein isoform X2 [Leguminivora glycinivorella]|uniref:zinc finger C4H2 domain-containing protein isoform X2 n=1 Tax=Leguminivora glycinivorella TaxID=1035111 RepID=UPI00200DEDBF|nr:zinc finger C4H2 domain-containing protein isoform X2 [Leguminivora glycinivorella]